MLFREINSAHRKMGKPCGYDISGREEIHQGTTHFGNELLYMEDMFRGRLLG